MDRRAWWATVHGATKSRTCTPSIGPVVSYCEFLYSIPNMVSYWDIHTVAHVCVCAFFFFTSYDFKNHISCKQKSTQSSPVGDILSLLATKSSPHSRGYVFLDVDPDMAPQVLTKSKL